MSQTLLQYQLQSQGGPFTPVYVPTPTPAPNEICIRTKAIGLNPIDWKKRSFGVLVESWPTMLGAEAAGIVESVGEEVEDFKPGDEVFASCGPADRSMAFQEIITIPSGSAGKKPASLTFEEAASLPVGFLTAAMTINAGLHVPVPDLGLDSGNPLKSVLVLGGSSACGAAAIQLLRLSLPSATILTTSSSKHHAHLVSLGATACFDRTAQDDPSAIKAATPGGTGVDAIFDAVTAASDQPAVFDTLDPNGPKLHAYPIGGLNVEVPKGVTSTGIIAGMIFNKVGRPPVMSSLTDLLQNGKYKVPIKVEVVGHGFEAIGPAVDRLKKGVSGTKCVVSV